MAAAAAFITVTACAIDPDGETDTVEVEVRCDKNPRHWRCDTIAPSVAITHPASGATVAGVVEVRGTADDDREVSRVEVRVDSGPYERASGTTSWSYGLDTRSLANGTRTVTARATDGNGNTATASITLEVENQAQPDPPPGDPPPPPGDEVLVIAAPGELATAWPQIVQANRAGKPARLLLEPTIYRESLIVGPHANPTPAPIVIDGNGATLSGADLWSDGWVRVSAATYRRHWPYKMGTKPNPWAGFGVALPPELERREVLFIEDVPYHVVVKSADLAPGTFFVDDAAETITIRTLPEHDPLPARVEVAVRRPVLFINGPRNLTVRDLTVEKSPGAVQESMAGWVNGENVTIERVTCRHANYAGCGSAFIKNLTYRDVKLVDNGVNGYGDHVPTGLVHERTLISGNNWRGHRVGWRGWDAVGKIGGATGAVLRDVVSVGNHGHGLWFDYQNREVVVTGLVSAGNRGRGVYLELNPGPMKLEGATVCNNGIGGINYARSDHVTVENSAVFDNAGWQHLQTGSPTPVVLNDGTTVYGYWLTLRGNVTAGDDTPFEHSLSRGWLFWAPGGEAGFWSTIQASGNSWWHRERADAFKIEPHWSIWSTHPQFVAKSGEVNGSFSNPGSLACPAPPM